LPFGRLGVFSFANLQISILFPWVSLPMAIGIIHIQPYWG